MQYVPPLRVLAGAGEIDRSEERIALPLAAFHAVLRAAFDGAAFDAGWYTATYADVATAVGQGIVPDAITHFIRFGYFEGRRPRAFDVDIDWYEKAYEDVAEAVRSGAISDARSHYNANGYFEPRAPDAASAAAFEPLLTMVAARRAAAKGTPDASRAANRRPTGTGTRAQRRTAALPA